MYKDQKNLETLYEGVFNPRLNENEYYASVNVDITCQNRDLAFEAKQPKAHVKYELVINYAQWGIHYISARVTQIGKIHAVYDDLTTDGDTNRSVEFEIDPEILKTEFKVDADGQILPDVLEIVLDPELKPIQAILKF